MRTPAIALVMLSLPIVALAQGQAPQPSTRELERINWMELAEFVPSRSRTVLLPLGTLEAHGVTANGHGGGPSPGPDPGSVTSVRRRLRRG